MRIDKWLWFIRALKSRAQAAALVEAGGVRLNGRVVAKPAQGVRPGDRVEIAVGRLIRRLEVVALGQRRGPAPEARGLYREDAPLPAPDPWADIGP